MSVQMKLGRWRARDGRVHEVLVHFPARSFPWLGAGDNDGWDDHGKYGVRPSQFDLIEYLGPLSPSPASAEAGPAGSSTVSTEDRQEQLRRMKRREAAIWRELEIYLPIVDTLKTALSNLEEEIKRLEKEVEG